MKFPVIGGLAFFLSGAGTLAAIAFMNPPAVAPAVAVAASAENPASDSPCETLVLSVPDMHCEFACAPKVRETLAAVPGVQKVETNVEEQTATVLLAEGFDIAKALAALEGAGYPAKAAE